MKPHHKNSVAALISLGAIVLCVWLYMQSIYRSQVLFYEYFEVSRAYARYVKDHEGKLPGSFEDLLDERCLTLVADIYGVAYLGPRPFSDEPIHDFFPRLIRRMDEFEIMYGGDVSQFAIDGDQVLWKGTTTEVIFVRPQDADLMGYARNFAVKTIEQDFSSNGVNTSK